MKPVPTTATVSIDFDRLADHPVSHDRIALFNSGLVTAATYDRDREFFSRTKPEHLRIDLGWGAEWMPWTREVVTVDADGSRRFDFTETDEIARFLNEEGVRPYWAYSYVPEAARPAGADWRTMAPDDAVWVDTIREYVAGARERGVEIGYHEVYNEPDLRDERTGEPVFYAGTLDDYLQLYRVTSKAIREADPTARIGGPALASVNANADWLRAFLTVVADESLPLDFLSFHHYGTYGIRPVIETVVGILAECPQFAEVELHLNEYNSFVIDYPRGGLQDGHLLAGAFAADVELFLATPSLTRVSWAQFLDSGNDNYSGMVDIEGRAKPLFLAYEFFQRMPVERNLVTVDGPDGVGAIASSDGDRRSVLLWNRSSGDLDVTLATSSADAAPRAVILDGRDDTGEHALAAARVGNDGISWSVPLARGATAMIRWGADAPANDGRRRVLRSRAAISDRSSDAWVDVDERSATIRFGTASEPAAVLRAGIDLVGAASPVVSSEVRLADGTPAAGDVTVELSRSGEVQTLWATLSGAPANAFATVRISLEA
ncbi:GH39 family glycosyl hydrolase [Agromyces subbeticus]|uniref:GH39 family glycosyl hydrolase n=1 Tax=Agromyces subbeticus TaxID=293890 RepID=UPI0003B35855|nr:hypothetical protein [Agromyces subbeticus]